MEWIVAGGILVVLFLLLVFVFVRPRGDFFAEEKTEESVSSEEPDLPFSEFLAEVVDLQVENKLMGSYRRPVAVKKYRVFLEREDGTILMVEVAEDFYDGFAVGQKGRVTMVGDHLYGFAPEEE